MANFWLGVGATILMEIVVVALLIIIKFIKIAKKFKEDEENNG